MQHRALSNSKVHLLFVRYGFCPKKKEKNKSKKKSKVLWWIALYRIDQLNYPTSDVFGMQFSSAYLWCGTCVCLRIVFIYVLHRITRLSIIFRAQYSIALSIFFYYFCFSLSSLLQQFHLEKQLILNMSTLWLHTFLIGPSENKNYL